MGANTIWVATANANKVAEISQILNQYEVKSLLDLNPVPDIAETGTTFSENAMIKAKTLAGLINQPVIADDSGLEVEALNGFPGIYSARWASPITEATQINDLLLEKMQNITNRQARFVSAIAYFNPQTKDEQYFLGTIKGTITMKPIGNRVFGYDQIFQPEGSELTFSQLGDEKNKFSHRKLAIEKLVKYLQGSELSE